MEDILYFLNLHNPLENGGKKPDEEDDAKWDRLNRKVVALISQWIDESIFHQFTDETKAYSLWSKLEAMYERKHTLNKIFLIRQLLNLKYKEGDFIVEHLSNFQGILNQLTAVGLKFDDDMHAFFLLGSLPKKFETLMVSLTNSAPDGVLTINMVKNSLLNEKMRRKLSSDGEKSQALMTESNRRKYRNGTDDFEGRLKSHDRRKCFYRGKAEHIERFCLKKQRDENGGKTYYKGGGHKDDNDNGETNVLCFDGDVLVISEEQRSEAIVFKNAAWTVDSAATFHATSNIEFFTTYRLVNGTAQMGNRSESKIVGVGDVCIRTNACSSFIVLKNVRHVPDIRLNLISMIALDCQEYLNCFGNKN